MVYLTKITSGHKKNNSEEIPVQNNHYVNLRDLLVYESLVKYGIY